MNPYLLLVILLAWCASLAGVGAWQHGAGLTQERALWQQRAIQQAQAVQQQEAAARAKEQQQAVEINSIAVGLQKDTQNEISKRDAIIARYRNTDFGLRQPLAAVRGGPGASSGVAAGAAGGDADERRTILSGQLEWLADEAARADRCLAKLAACRKVVVEDRK
jgi:hypothetical protein